VAATGSTTASSQSEVRHLIWMVTAALVVRLVAGWILYPQLLNPADNYRAFTETGRLARAIVEGRGLSSPFLEPTGPSAFMTPVYPYVLAGIFRVFGVYSEASALAAISLNCLFSALTCVPIFFIARMTLGAPVAFWAGWTWAFFPYAVEWASAMVRETCLVTLLFSLVVWWALRLEQKSTLGAWAGYSLLWGLIGLTNPSLLAALPFVSGLLWYRLWRRGARWMLPAATAAAVFLVSVAPWFVRNYRTFGRFVPFRSNFGLELRVGNTAETDQPWRAWLHPNENKTELHQMQRLGELDYMAAKRDEVLAFIREHPGIFAWLTVKRVAHFWTGIWNLAPDYLLATPWDTLNIPFCLTLTLLAATGLRRMFRQSRDAACLFALVFLAMPVSYYITSGNPRYRHPLDPLVVMLAVATVVEHAGRPRKISRTSS